MSKMKKILFPILLLQISVMLWGQEKLSPYTRHFMNAVNKENTADRYVVKKSTDQLPVMIPAFIHFNDDCPAELPAEYGIRPRTVVGSIMTADIPLDVLEEVAALDCIKYIEMGTPVEQKLDNARKDTKVDVVHAGTELPEGYTGKGVIVGVVDNGFDLGHPNFYTRDKSELRIKRFWDQNASGTAPEDFGYGCEYVTQEEILAKTTDSNSSTHGTHVLGIAAGADNTDERNLYGVATDAEIVLVALDGNDMINSDNTKVVDAVKYIFDYADSVDKPCVINLSLGSHLGPRDGSSTFDVMTDAMQGPGRLIVGAVGNDGGKKYHASKSFAGEKPDTLATFFDFTYRGYQVGTAEVWCDAGMDVTFVPFVYSVKANKIKKVYESARFNVTQCENKTYNFNVNIDSVWGDLSVNGEINPLNGKTHLMLAPSFYSLNEGFDRGFYLISSSEGTVHMWTDGVYSSFSSFNRPGFIDGNDQSSMGEIGGTGKRIISVGAYVTRDHYTQMGIPQYSGETQDEIASFSSHGFTADGRVKPDIVAPGSYVVSSLSSYYTGNKIKYSTVTWNDKKYEFGFMQGTSMASPFVAGVMAAWLQAYPEMTPEEAKEILQKTARQDSFTGELPEPSNIWGNGKIDAYAGIKECLGYENGIGQHVAAGNSHVVAVDGSQIKILFGHADTNVLITVYNVQGMCAARQTVSKACPGEEIVISLQGANNGVYLLQLSGNATESTTKKIIIN